jgi:hypothetical protein
MKRKDLSVFSIGFPFKIPFLLKSPARTMFAFPPQLIPNESRPFAQFENGGRDNVLWSPP